jgi:hypothetical protein
MSRAREKDWACRRLRELCLRTGLPRELAEEFWCWAQKSYAASYELDRLRSLFEKSAQHISQEHRDRGYREATRRAVEVIAKANQQIGEPLAEATVPRTPLPGHPNGSMPS